MWGGCAEAVLNQRIRSTTLVDFCFFLMHQLFTYMPRILGNAREQSRQRCAGFLGGEWQFRPADASPTPTSHPPRFPFILRSTACSVCQVLSCLRPPSRPGLKTKAEHRQALKQGIKYQLASLFYCSPYVKWVQGKGKCM